MVHEYASYQKPGVAASEDNKAMSTKLKILEVAEAILSVARKMQQDGKTIAREETDSQAHRTAVAAGDGLGRCRRLEPDAWSTGFRCRCCSGGTAHPATLRHSAK